LAQQSFPGEYVDHRRILGFALFGYIYGDAQMGRPAMGGGFLIRRFTGHEVGRFNDIGSDLPSKIGGEARFDPGSKSQKRVERLTGNPAGLAP